MKASLTKKGALRWALLLAVIGVALALLVALRPQPDRRLREVAPLRVSLYTVTPRDLLRRERYSGVLQPAREASLRFEVAGRVVARRHEPGEAVAEGEVILQLDPREYRSRLDEAEAVLARDRRLLELAERNIRLQQAEVKRLEQLSRKKLASHTRLDNARQKLNTLQTDAARLRYAVAADEARLARARLDLERTGLRAPFDGTVNRVQLDVGDYATRGAAAAEVIDDRRLELPLYLPGGEPLAVAPGDPAQVMIDERAVAAEVVSVQPDPDPRSFTRAVRLRLPEGVGRPGLLAHAELVTGRYPGSLAVPVSALLNDEGRHFVFVFRDGRLQRRSVEVGPRVDDLRIVRRGLREGERVVARDVAGLADGLQVVESR